MIRRRRFLKDGVDSSDDDIEAKRVAVRESLAESEFRSLTQKLSSTQVYNSSYTVIVMV